MRNRAVRTKERILCAAADLLIREGRTAVSTRAVSAAAGVQPPTLYRLFGDKEGLLDALAAFGFQQYLAEKQTLEETDDAIADLRRCWDQHIDFGLSRPGFYVLMYGEGRYRGDIPAGLETIAILRRYLARVAAVGRLRVSVERATQLMHTNSLGVVLSLISIPPPERDLELPTAARECLLGTITSVGDRGPEAPKDVASRAVALREALRDNDTVAMTRSESALLADWLDRIADAGQSAPAVPASGRRDDCGAHR
ncbi:TetR/AcrR family transcriptional regulator [Streptomyces sp. NPDC006012]|uniref:TetR/AcrR family transcriptional regulator n=1 Tax=Streptomyces sp. NPDC006012 TaxID=3364739 RepID=UPI003699C964